MKILVVEDNTKLVKNIMQGLLQEGYAVDSASDGIVAEKRILMGQNDYDLVILDRLLPGRDGLEICKTWRKHGIITPVLMLTALDATNDKVTGLQAGADDYLAKPFAFEELLARINALLRRPPLATPEVITVGKISLDCNGKHVTVNGKPVTFTLKEFMVLEYLMRNPGRVITRDTLYAHAWDFNDISLSNTVDVHIKNIRKKIHDNGDIIQTIRGIGYKIAQ